MIKVEKLYKSFYVLRIDNVILPAFYSYIQYNNRLKIL